MKTEFLLLAQYDGRTVIPLDAVCRDFFSHLTPEKLVRKVGEGAIRLPVMRMENSQKTARGVHVNDLAAYINERREMAVRECEQIAGQRRQGAPKG